MENDLSIEELLSDSEGLIMVIFDNRKSTDIIDGFVVISI